MKLHEIVADPDHLESEAKGRIIKYVNELTGGNTTIFGTTPFRAYAMEVNLNKAKDPDMVSMLLHKIARKAVEKEGLRFHLLNHSIRSAKNARWARVEFHVYETADPR